MNLNEVKLAGRLTFDPELKNTSGGTAVCRIRLAVDSYRQGKEKVTNFIDITLWQDTAENVAKYVRKGHRVFVEGVLKVDQWEDKETGKKRSALTVHGRRVHFIEKKEEGGQAAKEQPSRDEPEDCDDIPF